MFRNTLVTALRNIARHKLYSVINIGGLAVGLACMILVILFARDELSYDRWIPGTENLYRLELAIAFPDRPIQNIAVVPFPLAPTMRAETPGVTGMAQLYNERLTLTAGDRQFSEPANEVNPDFFNVIRLPLVAGDAATVFRQPDSIVLSQSTARKIFGADDPMGRTLVTGRNDCPDDDAACQQQTVILRVTGVMADLPHNTQIDREIFIPFTSHASHIGAKQKANWFNEGGWAWVRLSPGADPKAVVASLKGMLDRNVTPPLRKFGIPTMGSQAYAVHLTSFTQVHLRSAQWQFNLTTPGSEVTVYGVLAIGVLILLVACFNFMNLSTARATLRAREIALRKTMGASRSQVILQFLGEAVLMALVALLLALAAAEIVLPAFGAFLQRPLALRYAPDWPLLLMMGGIAVAAGLASGFYPALVLSRFRPAGTLRANSAGHAGGGALRNLLVVLQFAVSIALGIAALVVFSQITYARNVDLGFRRDNILVIKSGALTSSQQESFLDLLRTHPGIAEVGSSDMAPFDDGQSLSLVQVPGRSGTISLNRLDVDPDYPKVYGIKLLAGRLLSQARGEDRFASMDRDASSRNDGRNLLLNAAGARRLGFTPQQAAGHSIILDHAHVKIAGVLADTRLHGALEPVKPTAYVYAPDGPLSISLHIKPDMVPQTLAFIDKTWRAFLPNEAIQRHFLNDNFNRLYSSDERQGAMFGIFVAIAIAIACMGLFGLAAFTAARRTREIGIRKVFGARDRDVVFLLLWQFSVPVLLANLLAWPVAWYYLQHWLQGFADRIALNPLYFVAVGLAALLIAWGTVLAHALRVARANPIRALRYE